MMNKHTKLCITIVLLCLKCFLLNAQDANKVYFTTGFKIGDVTDSSAVILSRLCATPKPVKVYHKRKETVFRYPLDFDNDMAVQKMDGAVKGSSGQIMIQLISNDTIINTEWKYVSSYKDFTLKTKIVGLQSNTYHSITIRGRKDTNAPISEIKGRFTTAPSSNDIVPVFFTSSTCQYFWSFDDFERGFKIYDNMLKLNPLFHCQSGDFVYYDKPGPMAYTIEKARHKWHAMNSLPSLLEFYTKTPLYAQKDDHDLLKDDAGPLSTPFGEISYEDGLSIWREQIPIIGKPYRTFRWGKDLQIWLVEGREFRSDNKMPDGKDKTIWGKDQIAWFQKTIENSDATFKILISPTPIVGPDRFKGKFDNHSNTSFKTEGKWLRKYLAKHNVFVVNGDRHW